MTTSLATKNNLLDDIGQLLGLNDMEDMEQQVFLQNVGQVITESAVLRYVVSVSDKARIEFEVWLEANQYEDDLLILACDEYPDFAELLAEEMEAFKKDASRLLGLG